VEGPQVLLKTTSLTIIKYENAASKRTETINNYSIASISFERHELLD